MDERGEGRGVREKGKGKEKKFIPSKECRIMK